MPATMTNPPLMLVNQLGRRPGLLKMAGSMLSMTSQIKTLPMAAVSNKAGTLVKIPPLLTAPAKKAK